MFEARSKNPSKTESFLKFLEGMIKLDDLEQNVEETLYKTWKEYLKSKA